MALKTCPFKLAIHFLSGVQVYCVIAVLQAHVIYSQDFKFIFNMRIVYPISIHCTRGACYVMFHSLFYLSLKCRCLCFFLSLLSLTLFTLQLTHTVFTFHISHFCLIIMQNGSVVMFGRVASYKFVDSPSDGRYNLVLSQSQLDSACLYER